MNVSDSIRYVGVNDHSVDLFEGQYLVPNGMAYNSYVILDEKTAVFDTVDVHFGEEWLGNVENALEGRKVDYLIIQHMEPDHSASLLAFLEKYPETTVVGNAKTFVLSKQFYPEVIIKKALEVKDGESLSLGRHKLNFLFAPMVHWPEVMVTYDEYEKTLFSADAFGKFGALDVSEDWDCEARRYYIGIVGKYGAQVQKLLKAASGLDIKRICPLHGPVLENNLDHYIGKYDTWSSYKPEDSGVLIAYASIYGHTKTAAEKLAQILEKLGEKVVVADLAREDMAECVEDAFRYDRLVLASVTYNGGIFPCMEAFINHLTERNYQNRRIAFIENGSWGPAAKRVMQAKFEKSKDITFFETAVTIKSSLNGESEAALEKLAEEIHKN